MKTMSEVIDAAEKELHHVKLTDDAKKGALRFGRKFRGYDRLWRHLKALDTVLYPLKFEHTPGFDLARRFQERTGITYKYGEGRQTNKDPRMTALRRFWWNGNLLEMSHHTGHGHLTSKADTFREYHGFDEENNLIIVGCICSHLENYSAQFEH